MINVLSGFPDNVLGFSGSGKITRADYDEVIIPAVEQALKTHEKIRLYYEICDFEGIEPGAMWKDFKVGMGNLTRWERIAFVSDVDWIRHGVQIFSFVIPAEIEVFPLADASKARAWIVAR